MSQTEESTLREFAEYMRARATHMRYAAGMNGSHTRQECPWYASRVEAL